MALRRTKDEKTDGAVDGSGITQEPTNTGANIAVGLIVSGVCIAGIITGWVFYAKLNNKINTTRSIALTSKPENTKLLTAINSESSSTSSLIMALLATFLIPPLGFFNIIPYNNINNTIKLAGGS